MNYKICEKRSSGIDILKIISMYMVVIIHILSKGGMLESLKKGSVGWSMIWLLEIGCYVAVNCFAMVTGYLMSDKKIHINNILNLWFEVVFYSVGISAVFFVNNNTTILSVFKSLFPVLGKEYWYFTAYFAMFFLLPFINKILYMLTNKQYKLFIIVLLVLFSIMNTISFNDCFEINNGYSFWWLIVMYIIGAYAKRITINRHYSFIIGYIITILFVWFIKIFSAHIPFVGWENSIINKGLSVLSSILIQYTSPLIVAASIFLFLFMVKIRSNSNSVIALISKSSFAVYLIHTHPLIYNKLFDGAFSFIVEVNSLLHYPIILSSSAFIFLVCILLDTIRLCLFRMFKINSFIALISHKIKYFVYKLS